VKKHLKSILLTVAILVFLLISVYIILLIFRKSNAQKVTQVPPLQITISSDETWNKVADWRTKNNLKPFEKNDKLCIVAEDLANDTDIRKITFKDKYYNYPYRLGQVAIYNADSPDDVLDEWTNTPENLEILKKDWKYSCLVCESRNCAQIFSNLSN
jgi:hypothetical protein